MSGLSKINSPTEFAIRFKDPLCLGVIGLMASRLIHYFPESSQGGILIGSSLSSAACLYGHSSMNQKVIGIVGAIFCSVCLAKRLTGRVSLSLKGGLMLGTIQLFAVFILHKCAPRTDRENIEDWDDLLRFVRPGAKFPLTSEDLHSIDQKRRKTCWGFLNEQLSKLTCSDEHMLDAFLQKIDVNTKFPFLCDRTILHYIAKNNPQNSANLIEALAQKGADFNAVDTFKNTPLFYAIMYDSVKLPKAMIQNFPQGTDCNIQGNLNGLEGHDRARGTSYTALHLAITKGRDLDLIQLLIPLTNLNLTDSNENTPLHMASIRRDKGLIQMLLDAGADPTAKNKAGKTPQDLHDNPPKCDKWGGYLKEPSSPEKRATEEYEGVVHFLMEQVINTRLSKVPFHEYQDWDQFLTGLLPPGTQFPLHTEDLSSIEQKHFMNCSDFLWNQLQELLNSGPEKLDAFLEKIDVNATLPLLHLGGTILHYVANSKEPRTDLIKALAQKGADFNAVNQADGHTPLFCAVVNERFVAAKAIIQISPQEIDFNTIALVNRTHYSHPKTSALHFVIARGYDDIELIRSLIANTQPNLPDSDGDTPLHIACIRRDKDLIQELLNAGANPQATNKAGKTPLDLLRDPPRPSVELHPSVILEVSELEYHNVTRFLSDKVGPIKNFSFETFRESKESCRELLDRK